MDNLEETKKERFHRKFRNRGGGEAVYGLGVLGAIIYYVSHATGFFIGLLGIIKAFFWPAFLVYEAMKKLGM